MTRTPNPFLVVALLVSVFVHLFLFDRAIELTLRWRLFSTSPGDQLFRVRDVEIHRPPKIAFGKPQWRPEELIDLGLPGEEAVVEQEREDKGVLLEEQKFITSDVTEEKLLEAIEKAIEAEAIAKPDETPPAPVAEEVIAQEVISIDEAVIKEEVPAIRPRISTKVKRGTATSDIISFWPTGPSEEPAPRAIMRGTPGESVGPGGPGEKERMVRLATTQEAMAIPGVIVPPPTIIEEEIHSAELVDIVTENYEKIRKYPPLDDLLTVRLFTYHRPGERRGYFELLVEPRRDREDFKVIPKDIIFVVDSSKSITQEKLNSYVAGLKLCLSSLNPLDRFNIVEFKGFTRKLSDHANGVVPPTPQTIASAEAFLSGLVSEGSTDVYGALAQLVRLEPTPGRPRIIFLVSDGRPQAEIRQDRQIINQITKLNNLKASIFTFAGGKKINTTLLDLLSYRNRGARRFEPDDKKIAESLLNFYREFSSPILLNPRYNFGVFASSEVYPKVLPDLSLNSRLEIFGRFESEDEFSMQLLGEADGQTKEYVLLQKLTGGDSGDERTPQRWAFRKIYYLVGQAVEEGEPQTILSEIHKLSADYEVETSYYRTEGGRS